MPIFGRRSKASHRSTGDSQPIQLGRRMRSNRTPDECLESFISVIADHFGTEPVTFFPRWTDESTEAPTLLASATPNAAQASQPPFYVAIWERDGWSEIFFVTPDYARNPTPPIIGAWARRDPSLSSMGTVTYFPVDSDPQS